MVFEIAAPHKFAFAVKYTRFAVRINGKHAPVIKHSGVALHKIRNNLAYFIVSRAEFFKQIGIFC